MVTELRRFLRLDKDYRVEYGPFPLRGRDDELKPSLIKNIGGGGLMFHSAEPIPVGRQIILKIHLTGWRQDGDEIVESETGDAEVLLTAIAEVNRSEFNPDGGYYTIGAEFLGRVLTAGLKPFEVEKISGRKDQDL